MSRRSRPIPAPPPLAEAGRQKQIGLRPAEHRRYQQRRAVERVNANLANLKDNFAGRTIRVRGPV